MKVIAQDKANHLAYGAAVACASAVLRQVLGVSSELIPLPVEWIGMALVPQPWMYAMGAAVLVGLLKEAHDKLIGMTGWNWDDFWNTLIGAVFVSIPLAVPSIL